MIRGDDVEEKLMHGMRQRRFSRREDTVVLRVPTVFKHKVAYEVDIDI